MWQKHCDQLKERQDDMFKYLFYIFIIATSISAQTYTLDPSRDSLITYCLYETNTRTTFTNNLTQAKAIYLLNKSLGRVCTDFPALEKIDTVVLSKDSMGVSLNPDFIRAIRIYKIEHEDVDSGQILIPLRYVSSDSAWILYPTESSNEKSPKKLSTSYFTHGQIFFTHPKSQTIASIPDSFLVFYNAMDAKLTSGTDSVTIAPDYINPLIDLLTYEFAKVRRMNSKAVEALNRYTSRKNPPKPREVDFKR